MSPDVEYVEVQLELGHHAYPKGKIGPDGHTHDWMIFVRGPDDCKIHEFIEKVVFNLHHTFPKPRRSFRDPPYQVKESGYAGFELPIEIYFKNKEEPKKITYEYDLYLHTNDSVINTRREKLTFQNPSAEFKKKLLKAGGKCHPDPMAKDSSLKPYSKAKGKSVSSPRTPSHMSSSPAPPETKPKVNGSNGKIHHHRVPGKDISSTNSSSSSSGPSSSSSSSSSSKLNKEKTVKASAKPDQQFTDLFGPPIQTRPSPDSIPSKAKVKDKEKSKKQKSFHPEKSHSGERSNSRNSNSSTSNSSSTNLTTSNTCPTATTATSKDNSKDNNSNSNNNTTSSKESKDNSTSSNNNNNSNSSSNSNSLTSGSDKVKKSSSSSSSTSSSLTSFRHSAQLSEDYLQQLYWIQKRINELEDPNILQKLVDIIEHNSSCFNITSSTFDFDLLRLDESTVSKLKEVIQGT